MVSIHIGFLVVIFLLFFFAGTIIPAVLFVLLKNKQKEKKTLPLNFEIVNKFYTTTSNEDGSVEESELKEYEEVRNVNYNVPVNLKDKKAHRVSNVVLSPNCKKIKIP